MELFRTQAEREAIAADEQHRAAQQLAAQVREREQRQESVPTTQRRSSWFGRTSRLSTESSLLEDAPMEYIPITSQAAQARISVLHKAKSESSLSFRIKKFIKYIVLIIGAVWKLFEKRPDRCTEHGNYGQKYKSELWVTKIHHRIDLHWNTVLRYLFLIVVILIAAWLYSRYIFRPEQYHAALKVHSLMKYNPSEKDKLSILNEPAVLVDINDIKKGNIQGYPLDLAKKRLVDLHQNHPNDGHLCLTAKHLNKTWAMISIQNEDNSVSFVFNPNSENFAVLSDKPYVNYNETSDFFPTNCITVKRPTAAWVSWINSAGTPERSIIEGTRLACIMQAWEVLNGKHAERFRFMVSK